VFGNPREEPGHEATDTWRREDLPFFFSRIYRRGFFVPPLEGNRMIQ